jgi:hypothetical protein
MSDERDSGRPHDLNYSPPRPPEYPWRHHVLWALVAIVVVILLMELVFPRLLKLIHVLSSVSG